MLCLLKISQEGYGHVCEVLSHYYIYYTLYVVSYLQSIIIRNFLLTGRNLVHWGAFTCIMLI